MAQLKYLTDLKSALITALLVAFGLQIVLWILRPLIPYIIIGLVVVSITGYLHHHKTRL